MEENKQNISPSTSSTVGEEKYQKPLKLVIFGILGFIIIVLVFGAGMIVGGMKARFSYRWAENYQRNFAGPSGGFLFGLGTPPLPGDFIGSHGVFGKIIKINDSNITISGVDAEKIIVINGNTVLEKGMDKITKDDLKVGDEAVVVGSPNDQGQIEAKLIRIFDPQELNLSNPLFQISMRGSVLHIIK